VSHLTNSLAGLWKPTGMSVGRWYSVPDFDDTVLTFLALARTNQAPDPGVFSHFELDDHFWCFQYERDASASVHVHLVEALKSCPPFAGRDAMLAKALGFLKRAQISRSFWFDKWHASPYYTTAHAIIATVDLEPELTQDAVTWMLQTQRPDGSWGYLTGTTEETAYTLQALAFLHRRTRRAIPAIVFKQGAEYLEASVERQVAHYKPLWIGKTLYYSTWIVHSAVLSALAMVQRM
jgi:halimadienyl-diphosphate synthase